MQVDSQERVLYKKSLAGSLVNFKAHKSIFNLAFLCQKKKMLRFEKVFPQEFSGSSLILRNSCGCSALSDKETLG